MLRSARHASCRHFKGKELRPDWLRWHRTSSTDLLRIVLLLAVAVEVVGIAVALFHSLIMKSVKSQFPGKVPGVKSQVSGFKSMVPDVQSLVLFSV